MYNISNKENYSYRVKIKNLLFNVGNRVAQYFYIAVIINKI